MSYATSYEAPNGNPTTGNASSTSSFTSPSDDTTKNEEQPRGTTSGARRTHWSPRQCRICLETVQPTMSAASDNLPKFLQTPSVVYRDDTGRLIRPCMCKGSSKYVHDACLQAWRHADPSYGRRNYWQCPTCGFKYRLARLGAGRFIGSITAQIALTIAVLFLMIFCLGFVADPIIGLYVDPWSYLPWGSLYRTPQYHRFEDEESSSWGEHFTKGIASMGVLGFLKVLLASPFSYFRFGGGGNRGRSGRDRVEQVSWIIIPQQAVYKGVRAWSHKTLEKAGERVMDVQNDDDDDED